MFATQLQGLFQKIIAQEEELEDGARLLAQGPAGAGKIAICGTPAMAGITHTLAHHEEAPEAVCAVPNNDVASADFTSSDRLLLCADKGESQKLCSVLHEAQKKQVPVVVLAPFSEEESGCELELTDVWIHTQSSSGIIPDEHGNRIGQPAALCTLFTGQVLYLYIHEILAELID